MYERKVRMLFAVVAIIALVLASCAPAAAPTSKPAAATPAPAVKSTAPSEPKPGAATPTPKPAADQPRYGGILNTYITGNPPSLDPQQESTTNTSLSVAPLYSNLVQADLFSADRFLPALAEKWESSTDGLTWYFDIRQGVKFHDGTPFTVDDAVFSLKRLTDPPRGVLSQMSTLLKPVVKSIEKDGNRIKVTLNYPFAVMLDTLANHFSAIYSEKYIEKYGDMKTTAMGTGPFKFKSYMPGISLEGVKNSDFWAKGKPYVDGYRYLIIKDPATALSAFRTGKINLTGKMFATLRPSEMETVKKENPELSFFPSQTPLGPWFCMNVSKPPFQDQRVRAAVSLALDRQAALKVLSQGYGVIGKPFPTEPWGMSMDEYLKMPGVRQPKDQDIAEAKRLMQAAGYPDGFELTILARQMWQSKDAAVFMTSQLAPLGIKAKVNVLEDAIFWDNGRKGTHEAMVYTPTYATPDPQWGSRHLAPGGTLNHSKNDDDKELAQMWDEQIKTVDLEKRKALVRKMEQYVLEALPGVQITWYHQFIGVRPEVKNFSPGRSDYFSNTLEDFWLAK